MNLKQLLRNIREDRTPKQLGKPSLKKAYDRVTKAAKEQVAGNGDKKPLSTAQAHAFLRQPGPASRSR